MNYFACQHELTYLFFLVVCQIELQEQKRSGRSNRTKDSKRKRKSQKSEGGAKSAEASESKKTRPVDHTPVQQPEEVRLAQSFLGAKYLNVYNMNIATSWSDGLLPANVF